MAIEDTTHDAGDLQTYPILELLLESAKAINSEVELEKLVQRITDIGTSLSGAQFGAFFYNVENPGGEKYLLYTISGVPKEAFSKFPMPRNTKIFGPTFSGKGVVRYDDVTQQPHYGQNAPYHGMPRGHLPVRSYLAAPVVAPITNEVIGGLFFGHSTPGVFTATSEQLIEGIAAQAAIAMGNARLFEEKKKTEKSLLEQKEQYSSIFNATSDAILIYDEKGVIAEANPAAGKVYGYTNTEMVGLHGSTLMQQFPEEFEGIREIVKTGKSYSGAGVHVRKDGTVIHTDMVLTNFIYKEKPHFLAVIRDVTGDKRTAEALQKSEALTHVITKTSPVALWITNSKGENTFVNQTWVDWTGKPQEMHLGYKWLSDVYDDDKESMQARFMEDFQLRKNFEFEFRLKRRDGEIRWCVSNASPYYSPAGVFEGYTGSCMDITERKTTLQHLQSRNVLINTITNNTMQALFMMDEHRICTFMNPAAEKMTGFKIHELQEKPLHYYVHHTHPDGRHFPIEECPIDKATSTRHQTGGEEIFIHRDGYFYPIAFVSSPIVENGVLKGTVLEVRDITEEKRIQQALHDQEAAAKHILEQKVKERTAELEKLNYELMQFTSVASHDLKEPLRKISIFSKLLKDKAGSALEPAADKYIDNIIYSSARMSSLIDDLLAFSRLSQDNLQWEPVNLDALLQQIWLDLEISVKEKEAVMHYSGLSEITGVPLLLGQLFQNLISNSLKFAHTARTPVITINAFKEDNVIRIIYSDNGIGFKNAYAEKIFEVFQRLHTKDQYEGTGIGLAIVKKIVSLHKGEIRAYGEEGEGSRFEMELGVE